MFRAGSIHERERSHRKRRIDRRANRWGACRIGSFFYIHTLDDGNQGTNNVGLRTQVWQVEDTGSPGNPGVPDGRLNMDGMSWEIEFMNVIQANPTLVIP